MLRRQIYHLATEFTDIKPTVQLRHQKKSIYHNAIFE